MIKIEMGENEEHLETLNESRWYMFLLSVMIFSYLIFIDNFNFVAFIVSVLCGLLFFLSYFTVYFKGKNISKLFVLGYFLIPIVVFNFYGMRGLVLNLLNMFVGILLVLFIIFITRIYENIIKNLEG